MATFVFIDDMLINVLLKKEKPSGGAAVQTYAWLLGLKFYGNEVCAITNSRSITIENEIKKNCQSITLLPLYNPQKGLRWFRWIYYRIPYLYKTLKVIKPDYLVLSIPDWTSFLFGVICFFLKIKLIIRVSCDHLIDSRIYKFHSKVYVIIMNLGFSLSYAIICQNIFQYQILKKKYPLKKIAKFGNPFYNKKVNNLLSLKYRNYIAWVGLFQYQKNMKLLYKIASKLKYEKFKIAGMENFIEIDKQTKHYIRALKKLENVEFVGFLNRSRLIKFLKEAKFLLNTSHYEGFSNTFLEALICGTPILTTRNANPDSIISEFSIGYVYKKPEDIEQFMKATSESSFKYMSENAIEYVQENHNYLNVAKKFLNFLTNNYY
jgi:glycosyltransferase involved in cell wall biosynthesis